MIPKFLQAEVVPYAHVELIPVSDVERTIEDAQRRYLIHVRYANGSTVTLGFKTPFLRGLQLIALKAQPVDLKCEDVAGQS